MAKSGHDNKVCFNHLIKECVLAGEWDKASEAITRMVHQGKGGRGVRFDHNTFNAVSEVSSLVVFYCVCVFFACLCDERNQVSECDVSFTGRSWVEEFFFLSRRRPAASQACFLMCVCTFSHDSAYCQRRM